MSEKVHEGPVGELPPGPLTVGGEPARTLPADSQPVTDTDRREIPSTAPALPPAAPVVPPPPGIAAPVASASPSPTGPTSTVANEAIVALVLALVGVFCGCGVIFGPIAIVQANKALRTPGADPSTANIARVLGIVGIILGIVNLLFLIVVLVMAPMVQR